MEPLKVDSIPTVIRVIVCHDGEFRHMGILPPESDGLEELKRMNAENPSCGHHNIETYRNQRFSKRSSTNA